MTDEEAARRANLCPTFLLWSMHPSGDDMIAGDLWLRSDRSSPPSSQYSFCCLPLLENQSLAQTDSSRRRRRRGGNGNSIVTIL